jgi:hypothetical protein
MSAPSTILPRPTPADEQRFRYLAGAWKAGRGATSSLTVMAIHPAYQQIIGMGPAVVPLLLRELEREPDHWFWALKAITAADPVPPEKWGRVSEMAAAWIQWGRDRGYSW